MITHNELNIIHEIEQKTGLTFLENNSESNLCFIQNNNELRDDFKLYFTQKDFENFVRSFVGRETQVPETNSEFWERVELGKSKF